ncbi:MAG: hypothetical protein JXA14_26655 [Anaerolineae bacterium]|nr:hypothetical protein [Anaerolineae bacterium]
MAGRKWHRANYYSIASQRGQVMANAKTVEAVLQARLPQEVYAEIEREWAAKPDAEAMYPEQRRDFLVTAASDNGLLMEIPLSVFGG